MRFQFCIYLGKRFFFLNFLFLVSQLSLQAQFGDAQLIRSGSDISTGESIDVADLNGDGLLDLIATDNHIYFHQSDTTLAEPIGLAGMRTIIRVEDMTGDGHPDIFATDKISSAAADQVHLFVNDGNGNFTDFPIDAYDLEYIVTGDFDGNGKKDFLMRNDNSNEESFFLSQTDTSDQLFSPFPIEVHDNLWENSHLAYDGDGDGKDELWYIRAAISSTTQPRGVYVVNFSADSISTNEKVLEPTFSASRDDMIEIADINNDGIDELVYFDISTFSEDMRLFNYSLNSSGQPEEEPFSISSTLDYGFSFVPQLFDVDNDQLLDIVDKYNNGFVFPSLTFENRWINTWFSNQGDVNFVISPSLSALDGYFADLNSDGFLDLLSGGGSGGKYGIIYNVLDYLDQLNRKGYTPDSNADSATKNHYFHDLDGDGFDDLVIEDNISLYYRKFLPEKNLYSEVFPLAKNTEFTRSLGFLDLNNTGSSDFYVVDNDRKLYRFTNFSQDIFNDVELILDSVNVNGLGKVFADLDNDGDKDIIGRYGGITADPPLHWWSNENGSFILQDELLASAQRINIKFLHDTDLDGDIDILFYNDQDDNYQLLENTNGTTAFSPPAVSTILGTSDDVDIFHLTTNTENKIYGYGRLNESNNRRRVAYKFENNTFTRLNQSATASNIRILTSQLIDLDNNGLLDMVFVEDDHSILKSVEIQMDGTMGSIQTLYENINLGSLNFSNLRNLNFHDTDNDGDLDFTAIGRDASVSTVVNSYVLNWYENLGSPTEWKNRYSLLPTTRVGSYFYTDIDQDNDLDLVKHYYDRLSWLENYDGLGSFATEQIIVPLSESLSLGDPVSVIENDFNQDGFIDIIAPENLENFGVQYHSGTTNPYQPSQLVTTPLTIENIDKLSTALFDDDAFPDLLAIQDENKIMVASNKGANNGFNDWVTLHEINNNNINGYQSINITGDDAASLVIFQPYQLFYRRSTGSSLEVGPPIELTIRPVAPEDFVGVVGDLDNDGDDDIIVMVQGDNSATYWFEQVGGPEIFAPAEILFDYTLFSFDPAQPYLVDIDQNGLLDITYESGLIKQVSPLIFTDAIYLDTDLDGQLNFGDVNDDGQIDFLGPDGWWDHTISTEHKGTCLGSVGAPRLVTFSDVDEDGDTDIIVSNGSRLFYEKNNLVDGQANFDQPQIPFASYNGKTDAQFADIDGDGSDNLILNNSSAYRFYFFKDKNGFNNPEPIRVSTSLSSLGDIDGDGDLDVLYHDSGDDVFINFRITDYLFTPQMVIPATDGFAFNAIRFFDQNEDGLLDIITMESSGIYIFFNQGAADFGDPVLLYAYPDGDLFFSSLDKIRLTDLDNDGKTDIIFEGGDQFFLLFHESGLNYSVQITEEGDSRYKLADVNDDQLLDLIYVGNYGDNFFKAAIQDAPREFTITEKYYELEEDLSFQNIRSFDLADLDNDSDLDLVYVTSTSLPSTQNMYWAENITNSSKIQGDIFYDANQNGIRDSLEVGLDRIGAVLDQAPLYEFGQIDGHYKFALSAGGYILTYQEDSLWRLTTQDESYNINIPVNPLVSIENLDFGFFPAVDKPDLQTSITSGFTRCNTIVPFWIETINQGTQMNEGSLTFNMPSSVELDSFNIEPDQVIADTSFIWNFSPIFFDEKFSVRAFLKMPPATSIGDTLSFTATTSFNDTTNDTLVVNDYTYLSELRCAYDPNDKLVNPNRPGEENYTLFEERLEYTIRFQNTGNDTAFNVQITDTLNINLDWATFRPLSASHPFVYTRKENGAITFDFNNIMLPDSNVNLIGSQGFVKFQINPNSDLPENLVIENTAHIYFDFNDAIVTNTISNTMVSKLPFPVNTTTPFESSATIIKVYPNPSSDIFNFEIPLSHPLPLVLNLYDVLGNKLQEVIVTEQNIHLRNESLINGVYFYQFKDLNEKLIQRGKLIKQK